MKKIFMGLFFVLFVCLAGISQVKDAEISSEDLEKELRATIARMLVAGKEHDLDTMYEIQGDAIGYGYRSKDPRIHSEKSFRAGNEKFWDSMESFEAIPNEEDAVVRIIGNVGVVLASFTEKFKRKDGESHTIEVRISMTFAKIDGKWKQVQYHRDAQFSLLNNIKRR
jgi:ketosteroid isomerase-like protein